MPTALCNVCRHRVRKSNVYSVKIEPEKILPYKQVCLTKGNEDHDDVDADEVKRVCSSCWTAIQNEARNPTEPFPPPSRINYMKYKTPLLDEGTCFVCDAADPVFIIGFHCRVDFFIKTDLFIPNGTKCCRLHVNNAEDGFVVDANILQLQAQEDIIEMTMDETSKWFTALRVQSIDDRRKIMERLILSLNDEDFFKVLGVHLQQFHELCNLTETFRFRRLSCRPLCIILLLLKLRHSQYLSFLKAMFGFQSKGAVSSRIKVARLALMERFVPLHLGPQAFPRPQSLENVNNLARTLHLPEGNTQNAVLVVDGTYVYVPKSSHFIVLKRSFSMHKKRHLLKMTMLVFPNGKILDIYGPYFADAKNNDASTLKHSLEEDVTHIKEWLQDGDIIVADRAYRDAEDFLKSIGVGLEIPHCLTPGQRQHPTTQANESRIVTKTRWIVESVNGLIKQLFKFFDRTVHAGSVPYVGDYFRICAAMINAFHQGVQLSSRSEAVGQRMLTLKATSNTLQEYLQRKDFLNPKRRIIWRNMTDEELEDFPKMNEDDLYSLTLGIYQIKMAPSYIGSQEDFLYQVHKEENDLLRVKISSRHTSSAVYHVFLRYAANQVGPQALSGWYCTCATGARTVGMCSHICAIIWYLCYARYEPTVRAPSARLLDIVLDAAGTYRGMQVIDE